MEVVGVAGEDVEDKGGNWRDMIRRSDPYQEQPNDNEED